jgi:hypothetical protein
MPSFSKVGQALTRGKRWRPRTTYGTHGHTLLVGSPTTIHTMLEFLAVALIVTVFVLLLILLAILALA